MYEDYQTLIVDLSLYSFLLFFGKIYVAHGNKFKILFLEQISTLTERSRFRSLGGSFLQITMMKMDSVNKVNVLYPLP